MPATGPTIILTRTIAAPAARVFQAWTDPALIQRWLAPHPYEVREAIADARPGGRYSIAVVDPEGNVHTTTGEYLEVVPGRRLVKTWAYDGPFGRDETPSILTVDFREVSPGVTKLTLTHARLRDEKATEGVGAGWALCLDQLAALFDAAQGRNATRASTEFHEVRRGDDRAGVDGAHTSGQRENLQKRLTTMKIKLSSVYVDNQDKALKFYTEVLGFVKKRDIPLGQAKWLTVVSPQLDQHREI